MSQANTHTFGFVRFSHLTICLLTCLGFAVPTVSGQSPEVDAVKSPVVRVSPPEAMGAVEVSVAINPKNPDHMIAASIARVRENPGISDFAYVSNDAGKTWKMVPRANPHGVQQGDDCITFSPDGLAIHTFISFVGIRQERPRKAHSGIVTSTSKDGVNWSNQVPVIELFNSVEPHEDKPWLVADHSADSPNRGNFYVAWSRFDVYGSKKPEHHTHVYFSRSTDAGKSYSVPFRISETPGDAQDKSDTLMGAFPATGPKGEVYIVWAGPKGLVFTKSIDAGLKFSTPQIITHCEGWDFPVKGLGRGNGLPSMGVDISKGPNRGTIYLCWADTRNGDPDVFLISSKDQGKTWSEAKRIGTDAKGNGREQWFPWMVVDPVDGSVNIAYYDRGATKDTFANITLARSVDGGQNFVYSTLNDQPYDMNKLGFFGDYLGLDCRAGRLVCLWMHPLDETRKLGISGTVRDFETGTNRRKLSKVAESKTSEKN